VIAQRFAADHPSYLKGLVLMNTVYRREPEELRGVSERLRQTERHGPAVNAGAAIERWFTPSFRQARPDVTAAVRRRLVTNDATGYLCAYRVFVEADRAIGNALTGVACPTLVITGTQDVGSTPEMAHRMAADLHDGQVVLLEGLRHMAPVEDPERMNTALLDFLRGLG
jgi:pimeloyl-ACP methyl ester carboxylesterase